MVPAFSYGKSAFFTRKMILDRVLGEVFRRYGPAYLEKFGAKMPARHLQAMRAIAQCRTPALGGHVYYCPECDETLYRYHSCRNRHCPTCQSDKAYRWLEKQHELLLPVPYFLLTVTLPGNLRSVARGSWRPKMGLLPSSTVPPIPAKPSRARSKLASLSAASSNTSYPSTLSRFATMVSSVQLASSTWLSSASS